MWNKNEVDGKVDEIKGKTKQVIADVTNDPKLRAEGENDEASGKVQGSIGTAQRKVGEAIEDIGNAVKK